MFDKARADLAALLEGVRTFAPNLVDQANAVEAGVGEALDLGKAAHDALESGQAQVAGPAPTPAVSPVVGELVSLGEGGLEAVVASYATPLFGPAAPVVARVFVTGGAAAIAEALKAA